MSVFKPTGTSTYWYKFRRGGDSFYGSTQETDKTRAKAVERTEKIKAEQRLRAQRDAGRRPMTLDQCFTHYADEVLAYRTTGVQSESELYWVGEQLGRDKPLGELTTADIAALIKKRRDCTKVSGRDHKGRKLHKKISEATVNRTLEALRAALYHARDQHAAFLRPDLKIKKLIEPQQRTREASAQEEAAIFAALREDFHDVVRFALLTGIRFHGCVSLTWPNINFETRAITYRKKKKAGRSGDEWGHLPMTDDVEAILRRQIGRDRLSVWTYVAEGKKGGKLEKGGRGGGRGLYQEGERYPVLFWNLQTRWRRALAKAGVADFRFHDLRHTAATRTLRATGNLALVQNMLGHAKVTTTTRYAHVDNNDLRAGMAKAQEAARPVSNQPDSQGFSQGLPKLKVVE